MPLKVKLVGGRPLLNRGKVVTNLDCCCGPPPCRESVMLTISGVSVSCGCVVAAGTGYILSGSIDGDFELPLATSIDGKCCYGPIFGPELTYDRYGIGDGDCSTLRLTGPIATIIRVQKFEDDTWVVYIDAESEAGYRLFDGGGAFGDNFSNLASCGTGGGGNVLPCETVFYDSTNASGGTATLST